MDENAAKLAKRVLKSEINLKNGVIADFQKTNRILDNCPLCHREDTGSPPIAPIVSLATRTYLTLPTKPEISEGGACIVPVQHRVNLLECDDDEWEEIRVSHLSAPWVYILNLAELHEKFDANVPRSRQGRDLLRKRRRTTAQEARCYGSNTPTLQLGPNGPSVL